MKITYSHYYGAQEKHNLQLYHANLQCELHEEAEALTNGWLLYNDQWYQSRSTRIVLKDYVRNYSGNCTVFITPLNDNIERYREIYQSYIQHKNYPDLYQPCIISDRNVWMEYYKNDELLGFTKFIRYEGGLESQFNAYLSRNDIKVGLDMLNFEVEYARSLGLEYLYIGSGYEKSSVYKAYLSGFEWWNGVEWSSDKNEYIKLCNQDSNIISLADLSRIANK